MEGLLAPSCAEQGRLTQFFRGCLLAAPLKTLGKVSYVTYLLHLPLLICIKWCLLLWFPGLSKGQQLSVAIAAGVPAIILGSLLLSKWVKQPGIEFGKRMASLVAGRRPEKVSVAL